MDFAARKIEGKNRVVLEIKGNNFVTDLPLKDLKFYKPKICQKCKRVSTHLADFVCGSGKTFAAKGYTVVACTNSRASDFCISSVEDGWFESKKAPADKIEKFKNILKFSRNC
jgi:coenzyme F420-reducing hydrogenase beta subunit